MSGTRNLLSKANVDINDEQMFKFDEDILTEEEPEEERATSELAGSDQASEATIPAGRGEFKANKVINNASPVPVGTLPASFSLHVCNFKEWQKHQDTKEFKKKLLSHRFTDEADQNTPPQTANLVTRRITFKAEPGGFNSLFKRADNKIIEKEIPRQIGFKVGSPSKP